MRTRQCRLCHRHGVRTFSVRSVRQYCEDAEHHHECGICRNDARISSGIFLFAGDAVCGVVFPRSCDRAALAEHPEPLCFRDRPGSYGNASAPSLHRYSRLRIFHVFDGSMRGYGRIACKPSSAAVMPLSASAPDFSRFSDRTKEKKSFVRCPILSPEELQEKRELFPAHPPVSAFDKRDRQDYITPETGEGRIHGAVEEKARFCI